MTTGVGVWRLLPLRLRYYVLSAFVFTLTYTVGAVAVVVVCLMELTEVHLISLGRQLETPPDTDF